ncbi:hypothetical protein P8452_57260 [Trifolium repens]|jgi:hypothetical protein|nr:hypothetical protein P8452_57260 [Trifolium repens]
MQLSKMSEAKLTQKLGTCGLKMKYLIMIMVARTVAIAAMAEWKLQRKDFEARGVVDMLRWSLVVGRMWWCMSNLRHGNQNWNGRLDRLK